ncbi:MAG: hypothetical protein QNJ89_11485 [Acidimicrobiia bacterium]|nr:hypothetical protein [Acidimicrobiia bacterium]
MWKNANGRHRRSGESRRRGSEWLAWSLASVAIAAVVAAAVWALTAL